MNVQSIKYLLRVWLTTGLISPLIFAALDLLIFKNEAGLLDKFVLFWGVSFTMGLFYSLPGFILLWLVLLLLNKSDLDKIQKKLVSIILSLSFLILTFNFFPHGRIPIVDKTGFLLFISYFFTASAALIFYKAEKKGQGHGNDISIE